MSIPDIKDSTQVYQGRVVAIAVDTLSADDGRHYTREVAVVPDSVAVVALDEQGRILLVQQYRHPMRRLVWEIPAGRMDVEGETPEQAALRELREEADVTANRIHQLTAFSNSVGWTTERTTVFLASDLCDVPEFERSNEEADIIKKWLPLSEALGLMENGMIDDAKTIIGILLAKEEAGR